ncbi:hypothetical protein [Comamonas terrigena]|uniref:hypothetical protein n=1 Tax=Comamonas terrigena TaxID=32013 RepID=UPI002898FD15|nr:hypothetical protein [Comamonas terrigena]
MLNELSCWKVDWTAIGSLATAFAAGVALYIGWWEPRRIQSVREKRLASVMASVLQREVGVLRSTGSLVASADYETAQLAQEDAKSRMLELVQCPLLHGCVDKAYEFPEELAYEMGDLYGVASVFELRVKGFGRQGGGAQDDIAQLEQLASVLASCAERLQGSLVSYTPARNRWFADSA